MLVYKCTQLGKIKKMENKDLEESATLNTLLEPVHSYHGISGIYVLVVLA